MTIVYLYSIVIVLIGIVIGIASSRLMFKNMIEINKLKAPIIIKLYSASPKKFTEIKNAAAEATPPRGGVLLFTNLFSFTIENFLKLYFWLHTK
mgnify:CR=1 FL=1